MRMRVWGSIGLIALLFGVASGASAQNQSKSWEVDVYGDEADVTYVPDGRDDVHAYDHNNHFNDRSYIEVDRPSYAYYGGYYDHDRYDRYDRRYDYYYHRRAYVPRYYRRAPLYQVEYHNRYRRW